MTHFRSVHDGHVHGSSLRIQRSARVLCFANVNVFERHSRINGLTAAVGKHHGIVRLVEKTGCHTLRFLLVVTKDKDHKLANGGTRSGLHKGFNLLLRPSHVPLAVRVPSAEAGERYDAQVEVQGYLGEKRAKEGEDQVGSFVDQLRKGISIGVLEIGFAGGETRSEAREGGGAVLRVVRGGGGFEEENGWWEVASTAREEGGCWCWCWCLRFGFSLREWSCSTATGKVHVNW